jgi:hypothetical protein
MGQVIADYLHYHSLTHLLIAYTPPAGPTSVYTPQPVMLASYLLTALVSLSVTIASPSLSRRQEGYTPLAFTSQLPRSIGSGYVITLSWTGGGGRYHVQMDSSNIGSQYSVSPSSSLGDVY